MKRRSQTGWLFLVVVLAAPALIYYRNQAEQERIRQLAEKKRPVPPTGIFQFDGDPNKPKNPLNAGKDAVPEQPLACPPAVSTCPPCQAAVVNDSRPAVNPPPAAAVPPAAAPPPAAVSAVAAGAAGGAPESLVAANWQDPLMSPYDRFLLDQVENERQAKVREQYLLDRMEKTKKERPIAQEVSLQGIISMPDGNLAIVNGDTLGTGDVLSVGAASAQVKVVRISEDSVVFSSKGRTFTKRLNQ